eukprot:1632951-Rhodomonas_salina.3
MIVWGSSMGMLSGSPTNVTDLFNPPPSPAAEEQPRSGKKNLAASGESCCPRNKAIRDRRAPLLATARNASDRGGLPQPQTPPLPTYPANNYSAFSGPTA